MNNFKQLIEKKINNLNERKEKVLQYYKIDEINSAQYERVILNITFLKSYYVRLYNGIGRSTTLPNREVKVHYHEGIATGVITRIRKQVLVQSGKTKSILIVTG